MAASVL